MPRHRILIGIALIAFVVQINVLSTEKTPAFLAWMLSVSHHIQILIFLIGSGLVAWGFSTSASQHFSISAFQHFSTSASQPVSTSASQPVSISASQHFSTSASQHVSTSANQPVSISASQHFSESTPQHSALSPQSSAPQHSALSTQSPTSNNKPLDFLRSAFYSLRQSLKTLLKSPLFWILALAWGVRVWDLEFAIMRFLDEIHYMDAIVRLWRSPQPILSPFSSVTAFTWAYPYAQSWIVGILGSSLTSLRLLSAIFGVAQVAAVHFLGKQLFDRKTALAAALVMATFPVHVHFSRIGINNIADPVFGTLALGFLVKGLRTQRRIDFVLAGYCLGWTYYFYEGGRLFFATFAVLWFGWFLIFLRRTTGFTTPSRGNSLAMISVALALIVPVIHVLSVQSDTLTPRLAAMFDNFQESQLRNDEILLPDRLQVTLAKLPMPFMALVANPDASWFYGGDFPAILPPLLPFFVVGVLVCLLRARTPGGSMLIWWILGACVGISFMSTPLEFPRYLVMFPAVVLIMGLGIVQIFDIATRLITKMFKKTRQVHYFLIICGVIYITGLQAGYYAGVHVPNFADKLFVNDPSGRRLPDVDDAMLRALRLPRDTTVILVSRRAIYPINMQTVPAFWGRDDLTILYVAPDILEKYLAQMPFHRNYAFFIERYDWVSLQLIKAYFAISDKPEFNGSLSPYRLPGDMQMALFFAPDGVPPQGVLPPIFMTPQASSSDASE